jgi:hypothetical protein
MTDEMHLKPSSFNRNRLTADANKLNRRHTAMPDDEALSPVPHSKKTPDDRTSSGVFFRHSSAKNSAVVSPN